MIFLHEVHEVVGGHEVDFEAAFRDEWLPALARGGDARLLYFLRHALGSGPSYNVVTITGLRAAASWGALAERVHDGDLRGWAERVDGLRHEVTAKLLQPLPWSPLQEVDFSQVPVKLVAHEPTIFMEDTVQPFEGKLEEYVHAAGSHYAPELVTHKREGRALLELQAAFRPVFGNHRRREVVLWQKIVQPQGVLNLLMREISPDLIRPGSWMHDALVLRDRWQSKLLRTVCWSPCW
jgi:hypothetical protein